MKRILSAIVCASLMLSMASCSISGGAGNKKNDDDDRTDIEEEEDDDDDFHPEFHFRVKDRDGNYHTQRELADHKLTMINFWEPWCGPCVGEMSGIEHLYETYKDQGFYVIGVYSDFTMEDDVDDILSQNNIQYEIWQYSSDFDMFQTGYVPTTIFVDENGRVLTTRNGDRMTVGAHEYEDWAAIVEDLLG